MYGYLPILCDGRLILHRRCYTEAGSAAVVDLSSPHPNKMRLGLYPHRHQVTFHYFGHVLRLYAGVPDVVGVDEDDGALVVAACTDVAQHRRGREPAPLDLRPERVEELVAAFGAAAPLSRGGAHEDMSEIRHDLIL